MCRWPSLAETAGCSKRRCTNRLTLAPGQRADLLLDLTGVAVGTDVHLEARHLPKPTPGVVGMMGMRGQRPLSDAVVAGGRQINASINSARRLDSSPTRVAA